MNTLSNLNSGQFYNTLDNLPPDNDYIDNNFLATDGSNNMNNNINMNNNKIINVSNGINSNDAVNLGQTNSLLSNYVTLTTTQNVGGIKVFGQSNEGTIKINKPSAANWAYLSFIQNNNNTLWDIGAQANTNDFYFYNGSEISMKVIRANSNVIMGTFVSSAKLTVDGLIYCTDLMPTLANHLTSKNYVDSNFMTLNTDQIINSRKVFNNVINRRQITIDQTVGNSQDNNLIINSTGLNLVRSVAGIPILDFDINSAGVADYGIVRHFRNSNIVNSPEVFFYRGDNTENINIAIVPRGSSYFHSIHPDDDIRLGVNTDNPLAKLHVVGASRFDGNINVNGITTLSGALNVSSSVLAANATFTGNLVNSGTGTFGTGTRLVTINGGLGIGNNETIITRNGIISRSTDTINQPFFDFDMQNGLGSTALDCQARFFRNSNFVNSPNVNFHRGDGTGTLSIRLSMRGQSWFHSTTDFLRLGVGIIPVERFHVSGTSRLDTITSLVNNSLILNPTGETNFYPLRLQRNSVNRFDIGSDVVANGEQFYIFSYGVNARVFTIDRLTSQVNILLGNLNMNNNNRIINLAAPIAGTDAANKTYVDNGAFVNLLSAQTIAGIKTFSNSSNEIVLSSLDSKTNNLIRFNNFNTPRWSLGIRSTSINTNFDFNIFNENANTNALKIDNDSLDVTLAMNLALPNGGIIQKVALFSNSQIYAGQDNITFNISANQTLTLPSIINLPIGRTFKVFKRGTGVLNITLNDPLDGYFVGAGPTRSTTSANCVIHVTALNYGGQRFYCLENIVSFL